MNRVKIVVGNVDGEVYEILTENETGVLVDSTGQEFASIAGTWLGRELTNLIRAAREEWKP